MWTGFSLGTVLNACMHEIMYHCYLYIYLLLQVYESGKNMCQGGKPDTGKFHSSYIGMNVCGSAYGCVVNGTCAKAAD